MALHKYIARELSRKKFSTLNFELFSTCGFSLLTTVTATATKVHFPSFFLCFVCVALIWYIFFGLALSLSPYVGDGDGGCGVDDCFQENG